MEGAPKYVASEMCETLNQHWGYTREDFCYKSLADLIEELCDCRRYGANFLLNVGPMANGHLRLLDKALLEELGNWVNVHKEAVYLPRPSEVKEISNKPRDFLLKKDNNYSHTKYKWIDLRSDWFEWQCEIIDEMLRVSKRYVLYNVQGIKNSRQDIYKIIGKYADRIHDIVIWHKTNGQPCGTPHKLSNKYEFVLILKCDGVDGVDVTSSFYNNVIHLKANSNKDFSKIHRAVMAKDFCDEIIQKNYFTFCCNSVCFIPCAGCWYGRSTAHTHNYTSGISYSCSSYAMDR
jgi:glycosyltransferase involved in cell wall biosynthesis